ncbi:MAG: hypothetical protein QOH68_1586, partial [Nocardioidaceae bacterium]|nr:hypothetical protein [Nocardioidaceae bacterium]
AALASLAPRSVLFTSRAGDAYLTIGSGTRSVTDTAVDGLELGVGEDVAGEPAGAIFRRRTGLEPRLGSVSLGWPSLQRANDKEPYDAVLGLLADTLHDAGVPTSVVANADGSDGVDPSVNRQAALAFTGTDGVIDEAELGPNLLQADPGSPFGVRSDPDRVVAAFRAAWERPADDGRAVVLVEASDLARAMRYRALVDPDRGTTLIEGAEQDADQLFTRLLAEVDPERDTVLVLAPYLAGKRDLTVAALRTPGSSGGYLRSASTQRSGVVSLVDVAPTILEAVGLSRPLGMEGRGFEVVRSDTGFSDRRDRLASINAASRFRERLLFPTTLVLVLALAVLSAATTVVVAGRRGRQARDVIAFSALAVLAALPVSYLARAFPLEELGDVFYWTFLVGAALAAAGLARFAGRRSGRPHLALVSILVAVVVVPVADVVTGSNLHMSAAFGYSPTGNSRLYGISNYSYGQLASATCFLAAWIAFSKPSRAGRVAAIGVMAALLVVLGTPTWGSDVGGILSFTPTILVFAALLLRYRLRLRVVILAGLATLAAVTAFGFIDLSRPAGERAHLGRLFERIGNEGLEPLISIVDRKLLANLRVSTSSFWVAAIPIALLLWIFLRRWSTRPLGRLHERIPTLHAALVGAVVAAVLGSLLNDSGAIVGGVASLVIAAALINLTMALDAT